MERGKKMKIRINAEMLNLPKSIAKETINGKEYYLTEKNVRFSSLGEILRHMVLDPREKICEIVRGNIDIPSEVIQKEIDRASGINPEDIEKILFTIYTRGLVLNFDIKTEEVPSVPVYNKEIHIEKLSTGYIMINGLLITNKEDLVSAMYHILEKRGIKVSQDCKAIRVDLTSHNKTIFIEDSCRWDPKNVNLENFEEFVRELAKVLCLDDVVEERDFTI